MYPGESDDEPALAECIPVPPSVRGQRPSKCPSVIPAQATANMATARKPTRQGWLAHHGRAPGTLSILAGAALMGWLRA